MKNLILKTILLIATALSTTVARASSECYGKTNDGKGLTVRIETMGAKGAFTRGEIIFEDHGNRYGYQLSQEQITQYFEFDETSDGSAVVGLVAYAGSEGPVAIKYLGPNFVDLDLKTVLEKGTINDIKGNFLRAWKGPGYETTNQTNLTRVVCATWPEI